MARNGIHAGVSVLMPVRNGSKTISAAVRSTLSALPADGRLLVADDGSTDSTPEILERFRDPRLSVHRSEQSQGVAAALNGLLRSVTTTHVSRMDSDDISLPFRFHAQRSHLSGSCDLTFCSVVNFGPALGNWKPAIPIGISPEAMPYFLLVGNPLGHPAMYGASDVLHGTSGYVPGPAEDYELWMRLAGSGYRLRRTAVPLVAYRHHQTQTSKEASWRQRVLDDPSLRRSHRALANSVGWDGPDFFHVVVQGAGRPEDRQTVAHIASFFKDKCRHLAGIERRHLAHQLSKLSK